MNNIACSNPILSLNIPISTLTNPTIFHRSDLFSLVISSIYSCRANILSKSIKWTVNQVNQLTGVTINNVDLSSNPTQSLSEIVFDSNFFAFGLYQVTCQSSYSFKNFQSNLNEIRSSQIQAYIQIIPKGLAIFGWANGVSSMTFGSNQQIDINPGLNSYDFDLLANIASLSYQFYCIKIDTRNSLAKFNLSAYSSINSIGPNQNFMIINDDNMTCLRGI